MSQKSFLIVTCINKMGLVLMQANSRKCGLNQAKTCENICDDNPFTISILHLARDTRANDSCQFAGVLGADQSDAAFTEHHAVKTNVSAECVERIQQKLASICDRCLPIVP